MTILDSSLLVLVQLQDLLSCVKIHKIKSEFFLSSFKQLR